MEIYFEEFWCLTGQRLRVLTTAAELRNSKQEKVAMSETYLGGNWQDTLRFHASASKLRVRLNSSDFKTV